MNCCVKLYTDLEFGYVITLLIIKASVETPMRLY